MNDWLDLVSSLLDAGATSVDVGGVTVVGSHGDPLREYHAIEKGPALVDCSYRGLLEVTGSDRASWLHNFTTNHVKTLACGEGNYAFTTNAQGRILFDLNILVKEDIIWLDLDRRFLGVATLHFKKYIITEDVSIVDRSDDFVRLGLTGDRAAMLLTELGGPDAAALPSLGHTDISLSGMSVAMVRHDFCGTFGVELYVPRESAVQLWRSLSDPSRANAATPAGYEAVQIHRIESGIPWSGHEITDEVLPAETGQLERAVAFDKGCYLGQEVVERMRSRGAVARRLRSQHDELLPAISANNLGRPGLGCDGQRHRVLSLLRRSGRRAFDVAGVSRRHAVRPDGDVPLLAGRSDPDRYPASHPSLTEPPQRRGMRGR
ncbi:MAG: folate-binding protein YgfZ [Planctomycetes bacterium]|nr:folate-binding protein YgfZ [Planctomycetota bacterium]